MNLSPSEQAVFDALKSKRDRWGDINVTMIDLGILTGFGRTKLSQTVSTLKQNGVIQVTRTKRNYGKLFTNRYRIVERTSTDSSTDKKEINNKSISIYLANNVSCGCSDPNCKGSVMNKWQDEDDFGAVGLFEGEKQQKAVSKKDPKTRHLRPQEEWTSADVASEFGAKLRSKFNHIPGLVNVANLRPILAKYRKEYGLTPLVELEIMEMMFGDNRILDRIKNEPHNAYRVFLKMLSTHHNQALSNLGLADVDQSEPELYVYASDGTKFDNSMMGRADLREYEASLK